MADQRPPKDTEDAALTERLKSLGDRLNTLAPKIAGRDKDGDTVQGPGANSNLARAMRLSSEFVAGILVGCFIGWLIDYFAGTSPWGLIVFLLLGFAAGTLNALRSAGLVAQQGTDRNKD